MIIKSLHLNNIRSYLDQKIDFPDSSILLSGDIGSGKSSILLALEFALFGVTRGVLSADSLLRKGAPAGFVELVFDLEGKEYTVKRSLKNSNGKASQHVGYVIENGTKNEGTPIELKSKILSLLNYPEDILNKKSLIYRYTVYTPQEDMKRILFDDMQLRLDTLRKVFNIDKYKTIQQNCAVYTRSLRSDIKVMRGRVDNLAQLRAEKSTVVNNLLEKTKELNHVLPELDKLSNDQNLQKEKVTNLEQRAELRKRLEQDVNLMKQKLSSDEDQKNRLLREKAEIALRLEQIKQEIGTLQISETLGNIEETNKKLSEKEAIFLEITKKINSGDTERRLVEQNARSILDIAQCPTCKQEVGTYHKETIKANGNQMISKIQAKVDEFKVMLRATEFERAELKRELEELTKLEHQNRLIKQKKDFLMREMNDKAVRLDSLGKEVMRLTNESIDMKRKYDENVTKLQEIPIIDVSEERRLLDNLVSKLHSKELEKLGFEKEIQALTSKNNEIQTVITEKEEVEVQIKKIKKYHDWLEDMFIPLMANMEKHVFSQVHQEFNSLFGEWFNTLIEDEDVNVRLDEEFSPFVVQNGYEIDVSDLSGGEKTCIALAYRLALNKVINKLMSEVKTKDLLILDEPTDGFSTDQLDKVRLVLDELGFKQVIIVSHESKIESFVEHVIRIEKHEHVSSVSF
jgi:DNA repair protein SbcC/Rad50